MSRLGVELAIMTNEQVQNAVAIAIESLKGEAPALDFQSVHERSTAHRLAVQLEPHFKTWNVDCEYDRNGQLQKSLIGITSATLGKRLTRYCQTSSSTIARARGEITTS